MRAYLLSAGLIVSTAALATIVVAQTPAQPTLEQMRRAVATLRGNRITTPND